jgi:hypothetical protein
MTTVELLPMDVETFSLKGVSAPAFPLEGTCPPNASVWGRLREHLYKNNAKREETYVSQSRNNRNRLCGLHDLGGSNIRAITCEP